MLKFRRMKRWRSRRSLNECHDTGHSFALKQYIGKATLTMTPENADHRGRYFFIRSSMWSISARSRTIYLLYSGGCRRYGGISPFSTMRKAYRRTGRRRTTAGGSRARSGIRRRRPRAAGRNDCSRKRPRNGKRSRDYHRFITCCSRRLTPVIPTQQQKPRKQTAWRRCGSA